MRWGNWVSGYLVRINLDHPGTYLLLSSIRHMSITFNISTIVNFPVAQQERVCLRCRRPGFDPWFGKFLWRAVIHGVLKGRTRLSNWSDLIWSEVITLLTKIHIVKAMVFPIIIYRCERWTINKIESQRIDALKLCCWRGRLRIPWSKEIKLVNLKGNQPWIFIGRTILWPPDINSQLTGKDPDAKKDWRQE